MIRWHLSGFKNKERRIYEYLKWHLSLISSHTISGHMDNFRVEELIIYKKLNFNVLRKTQEMLNYCMFSHFVHMHIVNQKPYGFQTGTGDSRRFTIK